MLSEKQTNQLKSQLEKRFLELRGEIRQELLASDDEQYNQIAGQVHDLEDDSLADLLVDINLAVIDQHIHEVEEIEAALIRISTGEYGICIDCNTSIESSRLEVQPMAKRCIDCQMVYERTYAHPGHHKL